MEHLSKPFCIKDIDADVEIINNLKTSGINKRKAEEKLFERFSYFIRLKENKNSLSREDLFDAYSDTVLAVINSITYGSFQNRSSLKTFVYGVYQNKCIDRLRRKSTHKYTVHKTEPLSEIQSCLSDSSLSVFEKLVYQSDLECIHQQMVFLSENCRNALLLSLNGYSDKEIAAITKFKTADVAKTSRQRSIKKLRQLLS
jgi:RNA polymerase sigma factor (sigma-70 family)